MLMSMTINEDITHTVIDILVYYESYPPIFAALNIFPKLLLNINTYNHHYDDNIKIKKHS